MEFVGARRRAKKHKRDAIYFKADPDAEYADDFEVDLSKVESFVALPPSPDNVVPVSEVVGLGLDGTFIGACTTAEEDLVMAALVLKAGLERGQKPIDHGRRLVVPGSRPIRHKLEKLGLLDVYIQAGFKVGVPGCSMCVGQGVDQAAPGEVWMSSQNRNFPNRMGPGMYSMAFLADLATADRPGTGSKAHLASAATVAASSFSMNVSDPRPLLQAIDPAYLRECLGYQPFSMADESDIKQQSISFSEPFGTDGEEQVKTQKAPDPADADDPHTAGSVQPQSTADMVNGRVLLVGDFIDTDAVSRTPVNAPIPLTAVVSALAL